MKYPQQKWETERGTPSREGIIAGRYETNGKQLKAEH